MATVSTESQHTLFCTGSLGTVDKITQMYMFILHTANSHDNNHNLTCAAVVIYLVCRPATLNLPLKNSLSMSSY